MPTYLYETIPTASEPVERFEVKQHFNEPTLEQHPESGLPVRRVISGGMGFLDADASNSPAPTGGCGPQNCGCGKFS